MAGVGVSDVMASWDGEADDDESVFNNAVPTQALAHDVRALPSSVRSLGIYPQHGVLPAKHAQSSPLLRVLPICDGS